MVNVNFGPVLNAIPTFELIILIVKFLIGVHNTMHYNGSSGLLINFLPFPLASIINNYDHEN